MRYSLILIILLNLSLNVLAQEQPIVSIDTLFCKPGLRGVPRAKGLVVEREVVSDYRITSEENDMTTEEEVRINRRWKLKARIPLLLRENIKVAMGIRYTVEEFQFENSENLNYPFYKQLQNRSLKSLGSSLFVVKPFRGNKYFLLRLNGSLNGDYERNSSKTQFLKVSATPLIGIKKSDDLAYGAGLSLNYNFGRRGLVPVLFLDKNIGNRWGMEIILPVSVKFRYGTLNRKNFLYFFTELDGANYNVDIYKDGDFQFLNKAEIRFMFRYEREIHDWLWFSMESGMRSNFNFDLSESPRRNSDAVISNAFNEAFVLNFGIFVVPPRKFFK
ncbi:MAG: DUF6268 family outer membrane beta-barrel protein [Cyclobacteriaceae bacterium]